MGKKAELLKKRDKKAIPHLKQYAPVWIIDEKILEEEEAVQFNVVFNHNQYGWVTRRYRYDGFNNILYHKGQTHITDDDVLDYVVQTPYVDTTVANIPNAYGG
jgi:hypothetical protein